jgi:hypothetical protein
VERRAGIEGRNQGKLTDRQKGLIFLFKLPDVYFTVHLKINLLNPFSH